MLILKDELVTLFLILRPETTQRYRTGARKKREKR